jgi:formylmethanofuran dehydrogenase subunit B
MGVAANLRTDGIVNADLSRRVVAHFACTCCACVCDDLRLTLSRDRIVQAEGACVIAEPWLLNQNADFPPAAEMDASPASRATAVAGAARILERASYPLIYGLSRSSTEGQRAAVALAESLGATIDTSASLCHAPSVMAQQQVGKVTSTLGEVRNRAELVVFWGSDPITTHPRHWERYSVDPRGRSIPDGRRNRFVVVADTTRTASAEAADLFIPIEPGRHFEALVTLRAMVQGSLAGGATESAASMPVLADLARRMKSARCGVMFFGVSLARGESGHCNVEALLQLVTDLNVPRRWYAMRMRVPGNVVGADSVLLWQTGYPFAVNMARGYPRYNPGEFSVQGLLERGEADACLLVGSDALDWLSPEALDHLRQIPTIVLDPPGLESRVRASVRFRTAIPGVHCPGTAYRMDGVPVPLRAILPASYPNEEDVLDEIRAACVRLARQS